MSRYTSENGRDSPVGERKGEGREGPGTASGKSRGAGRAEERRQGVEKEKGRRGGTGCTGSTVW
jgi:hypothetical protein